MTEAYRPTPAVEQARYETHNNTPLDKRYIAYLDSFLRSAVLPFADPCAALLEFGCGPQPVLQGMLYQYGFHAFGYDKYFAPDPAPLTPPFLYGTVTAVEVLEHLQDPAGFLCLAAKILEPGGILAIRTALTPLELASSHLSYRSFWEWWYRHDRTHIAFYSEQSLAFVQEQWPFQLIRLEERKEITFRRRAI